MYLYSLQYVMFILLYRYREVYVLFAGCDTSFKSEISVGWHIGVARILSGVHFLPKNS